MKLIINRQLICREIYEESTELDKIIESMHVYQQDLGKYYIWHTFTVDGTVLTMEVLTQKCLLSSESVSDVLSLLNSLFDFEAVASIEGRGLDLCLVIN